MKPLFEVILVTKKVSTRQDLPHDERARVHIDSYKNTRKKLSKMTNRVDLT